MKQQCLSKRSSPNAHLIGRDNSRDQLATPALIIELGTLKQNIAKAAEMVAETGKSFRPHFKAHKCLQIAELQMQAGAAGLCVATIGEAEILAQVVSDVLLTSVISTRQQIERAVALRRSGTDLSLVVDSIEQAGLLAELCDVAKVGMNVLIDLDMGRRRSGCPTSEYAIRLAMEVNRLKPLSLKGVQAYAGQLSHVGHALKSKKLHQEFETRLDGFQRALAGYLPRRAVVSGGSTGSMYLDMRLSVFTELQCGSYALMDVEYLTQPHGERGWPFEPSLFVQSSVISANWPGHVITDAGDKRFVNKYGYSPQVSRGVSPSCKYQTLSDEHGKVTLGEEMVPTIGSRIECIVPHCDPTVNLFDEIHVVQGSKLVDIWLIDGRGC